MPDAAESELIVLGGGPGGYTAAFLAADKGLQVTMIDASERPGGTCLHVGCIPSKSLLHVAKLLNEAKDASAWGVEFAAPRSISPRSAGKPSKSSIRSARTWSSCASAAKLS